MPDDRESGRRPREAEHAGDRFAELRLGARFAPRSRHLVIELVTPRAVEDEPTLLLPLRELP